MQRPFVFCIMREPPAGAVRAQIELMAKKTPTDKDKSPQTRADAFCGLCSCSDFVEVNRIVWLKCCARRVLHGQRVWDAAQQVLAAQGAMYIQGHCLQEQRIVYTAALLATEFVHTICAGVCRVYKFPKGTRTLKQSLVCLHLARRGVWFR